MLFVISHLLPADTPEPQTITLTKATNHTYHQPLIQPARAPRRGLLPPARKRESNRSAHHTPCLFLVDVLCHLKLNSKAPRVDFFPDLTSHINNNIRSSSTRTTKFNQQTPSVTYCSVPPLQRGSANLTHTAIRPCHNICIRDFSEPLHRYNPSIPPYQYTPVAPLSYSFTSQAMDRGASRPRTYRVTSLEVMFAHMWPSCRCYALTSYPQDTSLASCDE
jgi:hypothetical protein